MRTPKYIKIRDNLLNAIGRGRYAPGDCLPTRQVLQKRFKTTRATVDKALGELARMGVTQGRRRGGTVVLDVPAQCLRVAVVSQLAQTPRPRIASEPNDLPALFGSLTLHGHGLDLDFLDASATLKHPGVLYDFDAVTWVQPTAHALEGLRDLSNKLLITNRYLEEWNFVSTHHRKAMNDLTSKLLRKAGKRATLHYLDFHLSEFISQERREGFLAACKRLRRFYRVLEVEANNPEHILELIGRADLEPDGMNVIIAPTCSLCGAVLRATQTRGLQIGRNLLYGDVDNYRSMESLGFQVPTVLQDYQAMGVAVVEALQTRLKQPVRVIIPHRVVGV